MLAEDVVGREPEIITKVPAPEYVKAFQEIDSDLNNELIVGTLPDNKIVAVLQLTFIPGLIMRGAKRAQVEGVRVSSSMRSKGIGKKLMSHAFTRAKERGSIVIQLTSNKSRTRAIRFYQSLGFEVSHEGLKKIL